MPEPADPAALVAEVRARLADAADPEKAPTMQAYMKSPMPYLGVTAVPLRAVTRDVYGRMVLDDRAAWEGAVRTLWEDASFREERYAALELSGHRHYRAHQDPEVLPLYRHLVVTGAWWDYVDTLASNRVGPILMSHPDEVTAVVREWITDDDLWLRRTSIICQLGAKSLTDVGLLVDAITHNLDDSLFGKEFFIRKAIGWALREHAKTDPDFVRGFVAEHGDRLSGLSRRKALKHLG